jgi:O-antigen ligase
VPVLKGRDGAIVEFIDLKRLPQESVQRVNNLLQFQYDRSATERVSQGRAAMEAIGKNALGFGFGGFDSVESQGIFARNYPHNIFLEIAVENGWFYSAWL